MTGMTSFRSLKAKERFNGWRACPDFDSGLKCPNKQKSIVQTDVFVGASAKLGKSLKSSILLKKA